MKPLIVVDLASNHGGDMLLAHDMIRQAAKAGADLVKVQSYQVKHLSPGDLQYGWLKQTELTDAGHEYLMRVCEDRRVGFVTTVFRADRVPFLASLGIGQIKIGSGEAMDRPLVEAVAAHPWHVIVSTGLTTRDELHQTVQALGAARTTLLHTVSTYPTPREYADLTRVNWLRWFGTAVGYSDHTVGIDACQIAVSLGAVLVEKHFSVPGGRESAWNLNPASLRALVDVRDTWWTMTRPTAALPGGPRPYINRWTHDG